MSTQEGEWSTDNVSNSAVMESEGKWPLYYDLYRHNNPNAFAFS